MTSEESDCRSKNGKKNKRETKQTSSGLDAAILKTDVTHKGAAEWAASEDIYFWWEGFFVWVGRLSRRALSLSCGPSGYKWFKLTYVVGVYDQVDHVAGVGWQSSNSRLGYEVLQLLQREGTFWKEWRVKAWLSHSSRQVVVHNSNDDFSLFPQHLLLHPMFLAIVLPCVCSTVCCSSPTFSFWWTIPLLTQVKCNIWLDLYLFLWVKA